MTNLRPPQITPNDTIPSAFVARRDRALLDFVRSEGITILVVGRPTRSGFVSRIIPSTVHRLLESGRGFDIVIIDV